MLRVGVKDRLDDVRTRIATAAERAGRSPEEVTLVAISKTMPKHRIHDAYEAGLRDFGENRVQEFVAKAKGLPADIRWHFVGRLQRNKVRSLLGGVHLIHSVDRLSLAQEIDRRSETRTAVLIEVNVAGEDRKAGVMMEALPSLLDEVSGLKRVEIRGLMCMAPVGFPEESRKVFKALARGSDRYRSYMPEGIHELSMGMSQDYEVAVEEGATIVRVGEAIFGPRPRPVVSA